jgi:DNA-directed RNA polymerase beta' subunit
MLGKRVNNIGRAVTACDTSNAPDEVTLPLDFLKSIYMKEVVRPYNKKRLTEAFNNGPDIYPGADIV